MMQEATGNIRRSNPTGAMIHRYQAIIVDDTHPDGLFNAKVRLISLWDHCPDSDLPWAEFELPLGCKPDAGQRIPVDIGDLVWVSFPRMGDTRYPLITGSCYLAPNGKSNLPDNVNYGKAGIDEPPAPELSLKDDVYKRNGIQEYKTKDGQWGIVHVPSGSRIEISENGIVIHSESNSYNSSVGDKKERIGGSLKITITSDADIEANNISLKAKNKFYIESGQPLECKSPSWDFHN